MQPASAPQWPFPAFPMPAPQPAPTNAPKARKARRKPMPRTTEPALF